jgi:hypothetical protein
MNYPTTFSPELIPLQDVITDHAGQAAFAQLHGAGFEAFGGLRRADLPEITAIVRTDPVKEYCPNDLEKRLADEQMTEGWLEDGKGFVLLRRIGDKAIGGYGWTSEQKSPVDEHKRPHIPGQLVTFAERLGPLAAGRKLGAPFAVVIVSTGVALHGARNVGFESWGSNTGAIKSYVRAGAVITSTADDYRPTLNPSKSEKLDQDHPGKRRDVRLFGMFTRTFK